MNITKKSILTLAVLAGLFSLTGFMTAFLRPDSLIGAPAVTTCYLLCLSVSLYLYLDRIMVKGRTAQSLKVCTVLFILLFLLRGARYISFTELNQTMRYLWYLYYIPLLMIPVASLRAAISVGRGEEPRMPLWPEILGGISLFLAVLILTNDVHQWAFRLNPGFWEHWVDEYSYGWLYYVVFAWICLLSFWSLGILVAKCRISNCRKHIWVPLIPIVSGIFGLIAIALHAVPSANGHLIPEFPETFCFTVAAAWICCIRIGLVPANTAYAELFRKSSVQAKITNREGKVVYEGGSDKGALLPEADVEERQQEIHGGYVHWQTDVSELNRMNKELESARQRLEEETELIRLENELRESAALVEAKNHVYDAIAVRIHAQSAKISQLAAENTDPEKQRENLRMICVYGSYLKRMSNLMLLETQQETGNTMELALAFGESLRQLAKLGVMTSIHTDQMPETCAFRIMVSAYEAFETYIEQTLPGFAGIYVTFKNDSCRLMLEGSSICEGSSVQAYPGTTIEMDEETCFVRIPLSGEEALS